jgi:uncharacterized paraquat-inducible protein A
MIFKFFHKIQGYAIAILFVLIAAWAFPFLGLLFFALILFAAYHAST